MYIKLENRKGFLRLEYGCKYAGGSIPVNDPVQLIHAIEDVCGKGSYLLYVGKGSNNPKCVDIDTQERFNGFYPTINYFQQAIKNEVIEQARNVAIELWGNIPEMQIGWLENQMKSYVEDIQNY